MSENLKNTDVASLMKEFFINRDKRKTIKSERNTFMTTHFCDGEDCVRDGTEEVDFCDSCKQRHKFYLKLKELQEVNLVLKKNMLFYQYQCNVI